jgi:hypothetical protein
MRASVTLCTKNGGSRLRHCLDAIAALNAPPDTELRLVDNGSTDGETYQLLEDFATRSRWYCSVLQTFTPGNGAGRNLALSHSRADVHLFFDDDCYPDPDFVTDWLKVFAQHDIGFASGMIPPYDPRYSDMGCTEQPTQELVRGGQFVRRGLIQGSNMAFAHQCLEATGFFDERFGAGTRFAGEEWDLALRASAAGWSGGYFPQPRVAHDHRRTEAEGLERMLFYDYGAGAVYAKHALRLGGKVMRDYLRELNALRRHPARRAMLLKGYKDFTALKLRSSRAG